MRRLLARLRGQNKYQYFEEYKKLQWYSPKKIQDYQLKRIQQLLTHAYLTVPYYKKIIGELGMTPSDVRTIEDIACLPVLTKEIIKNNLQEMISTVFRKEQLMVNTSGGSTGEPLTFYHDHDIIDMMDANWMLGFSMAGWTGKEPIYCFWGNPREFLKKKSFADRLKEKFSGRVIFNSYNYNEDKIAEWVKTIGKENHIFLYGYTSVLADIAGFIERKRIAITSVKGILTSAEQLFPWQRELIQKSFGCRVFDQYGSREVPGMACECDQGNMHILPHSAYLEFVDDDGVEQRGSKRIIATSLTNFAMPFIRYDIGDYARPRQGTCPCGRGFPLMEMEIGRTSDCFVTPEGNMVYGTFFVRQMYGCDRVKNFQFHQTAPDTVHLYVVRRDDFSDDDAARLVGIGRTIREQASPSLQLQIHYVDDIPRTSGGKHRFIISDVARTV